MEFASLLAKLVANGWTALELLANPGTGGRAYLGSPYRFDALGCVSVSLPVMQGILPARR